jgi:thiamine biosynthesis lipoprotein
MTALLSGCWRSPSLESIEGFAQGTTYRILYWSSEPLDRNKIKQAVSKKLLSIDSSMSGYRTDSTIERFNQQHITDAQPVGSEIVNLVQQARTVSQATAGCYDLTIKPLFDLWGFKTDQFSVPQTHRIQNTSRLVGMDKVVVVGDTHLRKTNPLLQIDLSSIAQGYSVGQIAHLLESFEIYDYLVEIGGELILKGSKPDRQAWRVAIEKPLPQKRTVDKIITIEASVSSLGLAVMTSGTYRHFYDEKGIKYSHILDARTGYPVTHHTVSVTVLYPDATLADAWSTALLCLGNDAGIEVANSYKIPALFIEQIDIGFVETRSLPLQNFQGIRID